MRGVVVQSGGMAHLGRASTGHDQRGNMTGKTFGNDHLRNTEATEPCYIKGNIQIGGKKMIKVTTRKD